MFFNMCVIIFAIIDLSSVFKSQRVAICDYTSLGSLPLLRGGLYLMLPSSINLVLHPETHVLIRFSVSFFTNHVNYDLLI